MRDVRAGTKLVELALSKYGCKYSPDYAKSCGVNVPPNSNWCGLFCGYLLSKLEHKLPPMPQVARSYLKIGTPVDKPMLGDLAIFWRESPDDWRGHVSIYIREDVTGIYCLGGNQKGKVQILRYSKNKILGYRRIRGEP